jgi:hypothetical protein
VRVLIVVLLVAVVVIALTRPWSPTPSASASPSVTPTSATPSPTPSPTPTAQEVVFDATSMGALFVTGQDLAGAVPAASSGVTAQPTTGAPTWGLAAGSSVTPALCTPAVTLVSAAPVAYDVRQLGNARVDFRQEVLLLPDAGSARTAFATVVATVDACPTYTVTGSAGSAERWAVQPAIEGQGAFPGIVQQATVTISGTTRAAFRGYLRVGNTMVAWTVVSRDTGDLGAASDALGTVDSLSALVQDRALTGAQQLSTPAP